VNFLGLLQAHNAPFKRYGESEHVSHGWVGIDCPFCSRDRGHFSGERGRQPPVDEKQTGADSPARLRRR
jgi:hypothetical protein